MSITPTDIVGAKDSVFAPCREDKSPMWAKTKRIPVDKLEYLDNVVAYPPDGVIVVDVDDKEGAKKIDQFLELSLKETFCYDTEKGKHYGFREDMNLPWRIKNIARSSFIPELDHRTKKRLCGCKKIWKTKMGLREIKGGINGYGKITIDTYDILNTRTRIAEYDDSGISR